METTTGFLHNQQISKFIGRTPWKVGLMTKLRIAIGVLGTCFPNLESMHPIAKAPVPVQVLEGAAHCHQLPLVVGWDKSIFLA